MPFLDYLELAAVSDMAESTARHVLGQLRRKGLAGSIRHASPLTTTTRRWYATAEGMRSLASESGVGIDSLLRTHPASAHWRRILLARLDALAVVYRLTSAVADAVGPPRFRWYRAAPLDAAMLLPDNRTFGVLRQGPTADRTSFSDRVRRTLDQEQPRPRALLVLMPDEPRLRQARRLLSPYPGPVYLALEREAGSLSDEDRVWHGASTPGLMSISEILARLRTGGTLPWERPTSRLSLPDDADLSDIDDDAADHLLPAALKPAEKRMLDCLADWPLVTIEDLSGILGLSDSRTWRLAARLNRLDLVAPANFAGQRRYALSDGGLALLARRDRASVGAAVRRWSVEPMDDEPPSSWRDLPGARSRPLARTIEHTDAVHRFLGRMSRQAREQGCRVVQFDPPHRAVRRFRHRGRLRSVHPDAFGVLRRGGETFPFFLEWERRAVRPGTMATRLAPYLRYYSSKQPLDDHGEWPLVLVVFDDELAESNFHGVARREMDRTGVDVPLWVSHKDILERVGPLGKAWRDPDQLETVCAFN